MLVQQKVNTDAGYKYPETPAETLLVDVTGPTSSERDRLAEIEKRLRQ